LRANAVWPVASSYSTTPKLKRSAEPTYLRAALRHTDLMNGADVRMIQSGGRTSFALGNTSFSKMR
jgi:hypothetical protein